MKLIVAIVRPFRLEKIVSAFEGIEDFPGMTVVDSEGFGRRAVISAYDSLEPFKPSKRIEIATNDEMAEAIVEVIRQHGHTGKRGDGIITVLNIESAAII